MAAVDHSFSDIMNRLTYTLPFNSLFTFCTSSNHKKKEKKPFGKYVEFEKKIVKYQDYFHESEGFQNLKRHCALMTNIQPH